MIHDKMTRESWGNAVIESIAKELQAEFPGTKGFSVRNLYYMRDFYLAYVESSFLQTLSAEISWSHNILILKGINDREARCFYMQKSVENGWSYRVLQHQIELGTYQRSLNSQNNFKQALPAEVGSRMNVTVKDEYIFDFLGLHDAHSERELETSILRRINLFLIEMGGAYTFAGNQFKLTVDGDEFFIDILLFHRRLKCLVAIELKIGEFKPEYAGKMQFYLNALEANERQEGENPPIGIILCKSKKKTIVEYSLRDASRPMAVATYRVTEHLPPRLKKELPTAKQVESLLDLNEETTDTLRGGARKNIDKLLSSSETRGKIAKKTFKNSSRTQSRKPKKSR